MANNVTQFRPGVHRGPVRTAYEAPMAAPQSWDPQWPHPEHPIWPPGWNPQPLPGPGHPPLAAAGWGPPWPWMPPPGPPHAHGCRCPSCCPPPVPCPPPHPPSCDAKVIKANQCWDQTQALTNLITQIIEDIFAKNPGIIPPPNPIGGSGPLLGVSDGSKAAPGIVGQVIHMEVNIPYAGYPAITQPVVNVGVLPPGDWQMFPSMEFVDGAAGAIGGASFALSGTTGVSSDMNGLVIFGVTVGQAEEGATVVGQTGSASWAVPTMISFQVVINQSTDATLPAGNATFRLEARRMR